MVIAVLPARHLLVKAGIGGHIDLAAQDGLDALRPGLLIEIYHAEHGAVVRNGRRRHAQLLHPGHVLLNLVGAVQKAVFRMCVQMCKWHSFLSPFSAVRR